MATALKRILYRFAFLDRPGNTTSTPGLSSAMVAIFCVAVAIRWAYAVLLYSTMGLDGILIADSYRYVSQAQAFAQMISAGSVSGWNWLGPDLDTMPLFAWLITITALAAGEWTPFCYVLMQGVMDGVTCVMIGGIARSIDPRLTLLASTLAAFNPTQVVLSGLVYTDTAFLMAATLSIWATVRWMKAPRWQEAVVIGISFGAAALIRALIAPWIVVLVVYLLVALIVQRRFTLERLFQIAGMAAIFALVVAAVLARNVSQHNAWALTPQTGMHLALWVVPLVQETRTGTPWSAGVAEMQKRTSERYGPQTLDQFESSRRYTKMALEELRSVGFGAIAKAWTLGIGINLAAPALIISPPVMQLPRTGFFATPGGSPFEKVFNFVFRSNNPLYGRLLLVGLLGVAIARMVQLSGLVFLCRDRNTLPVLTLLMVWCAFILLVNGPVASPKYRLPIEPVLMILGAAGLYHVRLYWIAKRDLLKRPR